MVLIGIIGKKGVGKSTCASYLTSRYGFHEKAMADCLKNICRELFLLDDSQINGVNKETVDARWGCTPRQMFQYIGTDLFRNQLHVIMPDVGLNVFIHHFELWYANQSGNVVVSDIRFQNEADMIIGLGGILIKLDRHDIDNMDSHASETELDNITCYNYHIINDDSLTDLYSKLDDIIKLQ